MKFSLLFVVLCALLFTAASCQVAGVRPELDVSVENKSSRDVEHVRAKFGDYACSWGNVGRTFKAIYGQFSHPITSQAELQWDVDGKRRTQKFELGGIYPSGKSGRLSFIIHDDHAEVTFRELARTK